MSAEEVEEREFISPAFAISKRDGVTMRIVFDLRKLNSMLERKQTHMSTIEELIQGIGGFIFASVVDLNMGYLSIPLTESSKKLFTIVFPFGYFECQVLPQGAKPATDIFQSRMVGMFASMWENRPYPYLDDIFIIKARPLMNA